MTNVLSPVTAVANENDNDNNNGNDNDGLASLRRRKRGGIN